MNFTRGPWKTRLSKPVMVLNEDGISICGVHIGNTLKTKRDIDIVHANAHLIAAAPDLYEALELLSIGHTDAVKVMQASLKKARGESQ